MPRSVDVIVRNDVVEVAKAGDKCTFIGTFVVVPDVAQLMRPGAVKSFQHRSGPAGGRGTGEGVTGLKALGVRDLTYRTAFLACTVQPDSPMEDEDAANAMDAKDQEEILAMSRCVACTQFLAPALKLSPAHMFQSPNLLGTLLLTIVFMQ